MNSTLSMIVFVLAFAPTGASYVKHTPVFAKGEMILVGSTPGDAAVKSALSIDPSTHVDFIRWDLRMDEKPGPFVLNIVFGEGEPNTPGFKKGGEAKKFEGTYTLSKDARGDAYRFTSTRLPATISLLKLGENVFHILSSNDELMAGNGGWSYTLIRKNPVFNKTGRLVSRSKMLLDDTAPEMIFEGRTPCADFGRPDLPYTDGCRRLKWKLTLKRDVKTKQAATYVLETTLNRRQAIEGKWALVNGTHANPRALLLRLDHDRPNEAMTFLIGDENVLFFLDKSERLLAGNEDFGFTLNRQSK
jgi:hypothetical protein